LLYEILAIESTAATMQLGEPIALMLNGNDRAGEHFRLLWAYFAKA
jgi:hypothetical protein